MIAELGRYPSIRKRGRRRRLAELLEMFVGLQMLSPQAYRLEASIAESGLALSPVRKRWQRGETRGKDDEIGGQTHQTRMGVFRLFGEKRKWLVVSSVECATGM